MTRTKCGMNRYWSKEEKLRIIKRVVENHEATLKVSNSENISNGMLNNWLKKYYEYGDKGLERKSRPGNPLIRYSSRKELTELEKLQYENMKLKIELERAKKGYIVEGDGLNKVFIFLKDKNMK